jgi:hypothetical protein
MTEQPDGSDIARSPHLIWFTATASGANGGCVEVAHLSGGAVAVRDTKDRTRPPLVYSAHAWACFLDGAKNGEFDPPRD